MMTVKTSVAASNGLPLKNLAPVPSSPSEKSKSSPPIPPNIISKPSTAATSEAKKGSRFSFSVDSLLSTVAHTKKSPSPTYTKEDERIVPDDEIEMGEEEDIDVESDDDDIDTKAEPDDQDSDEPNEMRSKLAHPRPLFGASPHGQPPFLAAGLAAMAAAASAAASKQPQNPQGDPHGAAMAAAAAAAAASAAAAGAGANPGSLLPPFWPQWLAASSLSLTELSTIGISGISTSTFQTRYDTKTTYGSNQNWHFTQTQTQ